MPSRRKKVWPTLIVVVLHLVSLSFLTDSVPAGEGRDQLQGVDRQTRDEMRRLMIDIDGQAGLRGGKPSSHELRAKCPLTIEPFSIKPYSHVEGAPVPASFERVTIGPDGNFMRNGRPVFLLGADAAVFISPQMTRLLGFDFVQLHSFYDDSSWGIEKAGQGFRLYRKPFRWIETQLAMLTDRGLLAYIAGNEGNLRKRVLAELPKTHLYIRRPDLLVEAGHFIKYRHENPEARQLRYEFWKSILHSTRRYPVFAYELFNELGYTDYAPQSIRRFKDLMGQKHGSVDAANRVWRTSYTSFDEIVVPRIPAFANGVRLILGEDVCEELFREYARFNEARSSEIIRELTAFIRHHDPRTYLTVQSHVQLKFDYGAQGVNPLLKVRHEDFYGDERGMGVLREDRPTDNHHDVLDCLKTVMAFDVVRAASPSKPILNAESPPRGGYGTASPADRIVDLAGEWRFMPDVGANGVRSGFHTAQFDDSRWHTLQAPGSWASQGYPRCRVGWYRRRFTIPENQDGPVFLNGYELADRARLFVDGKEVFRTKRWNDYFSVDLSELVRKGERQVLAALVSCRAIGSGLCRGGIRGGLSIDSARSGVMIPMDVQGLRTCLWTMAVHGQCAVNLSYSGVAEGWRISLFNPERVSPLAVAAIPKVKREISSVGDLVLPRPRIRAKVAIYYPLEAFRSFIPESMAQRASAPLNADLIRAYGALLVSGHPVDFVFSRDLSPSGLSRYAVLFVKNATRLPEDCVEGLRQYVDSGGIVVTDSDSFQITDELCKPIDFSLLTGCRRGSELEAGKCDLTSIGGESETPFTPKNRDGRLGTSLLTRDAEAVVTKGETTLVAKHVVGGGKVITVGCELGLSAWRSLACHVIEKEAGLAEEMEIRDVRTSKRPAYLESHLFRKEGGLLAVLVNWGAARDVKVTLSGLAKGEYLLRDVGTGAKLGVYSAESLTKTGLTVSLASRAPLVMLMEKGSMPERTLHGVPAEDRALLETMHANVGAADKAKRLLFTAHTLETVCPIKVPEAIKILKGRGSQVDVLLKWPEGSDRFSVLRGSRVETATLDYYGTVVLAAPRIGFGPKEWETRKYLDYVDNGGNLLMGFVHYEGPHNWHAPWRAKLHFGKLMGFDVRDNLTTKRPVLYDEPAFAQVRTHDASHPILRGVSTHQTFGSLVLVLEHADWRPILTAGEDTSHPGKPVLAERRWGKGLIVIAGGLYWWVYLNEDHGDNRRLFCNLFDYLAH